MEDFLILLLGNQGLVGGLVADLAAAGAVVVDAVGEVFMAHGGKKIERR